MSQIVQACVEQGVAVDAATSLEGTNVLWDQQEMSASIRMLQDIVYNSDLQSQDIHVGKPALLAKLVNIVFLNSTRLLRTNTRIGPSHFRSAT